MSPAPSDTPGLLDEPRVAAWNHRVDRPGRRARRPDASITTFGDSLWWTVTTISTVGYGDRYPVTVEGRIVAAVLMVAGIALLGVVTASIASWFVDTVRATGRDVTEEVS